MVGAEKLEKQKGKRGKMWKFYRRKNETLVFEKKKREVYKNKTKLKVSEVGRSRNSLKSDKISLSHHEHRYHGLVTIWVFNSMNRLLLACLCLTSSDVGKE